MFIFKLLFYSMSLHFKERNMNATLNKKKEQLNLFIIYISTFIILEFYFLLDFDLLLHVDLKVMDLRPACIFADWLV